MLPPTVRTGKGSHSLRIILPTVSHRIGAEGGSWWLDRMMKVGPVVYAVEFDHQMNVDSVYTNEHRSAAVLLDYLSRHNHRQIAWFGILDRNAPYQVVFDALDESSVVDRQAFSTH